MPDMITGSESPLSTSGEGAEGGGRRHRARRGEGELLRGRIIDAAERLLLESGGDEDAVSIRAVSDAVGVSPPSIYLHFADKTELVFEVCEKNFRIFDETLEAAAAQGNDPVEALGLRCKAYIRFGQEHPGPYRILFLSKPTAVPRDWSLERVMPRDGAFAHLVQNVQACIDAGAFEHEDPVLIATLLWSCVHGVTALLVTGNALPVPDVDAVVAKLRQVCMRGLAPESGNSQT